MSARVKQKTEESNDHPVIDTLVAALTPHMKQIAQEAVEGMSDLQSFSIPEVMKRLDVSEYIVRKMIAEGTLQTVRPTEGSVRVTARSIRLFLYGDKVEEL
jgi:hypothetical protein